MKKSFHLSLLKRKPLGLMKHKMSPLHEISCSWIEFSNVWFFVVVFFKRQFQPLPFFVVFFKYFN